MRPHLHALWLEFRCLAGGAYPAFVTQARPGPWDPASVPVFMFHTVTAERFEAQARFLAQNGYATLNADELHAHLTDSAAPRRRAVALTFDDGERSWHRVAMPILKRHGLQAIGFVAPGCLRERPGPDTPGKQWLTWNELAELQASGTFDIQSHTLHHERMFAGGRLMDFFRPGLFPDALETDRPRVLQRGESVRLSALGAPLFAMASRMSDPLKFLDDEAVRAACVEAVAAGGGEAFFQTPGWKKRLRIVYREAVRARGAGRFETAAEQAAAIHASLAESRRLLEERLTKRVLDLAYPWGIGGELATRLSREAGYRTNYRVPAIGRPSNRPGQDPFQIVRLKDDYIFRLPGEGRLPLRDIFRQKFSRRRTQADIY